MQQRQIEIAARIQAEAKQRKEAAVTQELDRLLNAVETETTTPHRSHKQREHVVPFAADVNSPVEPPPPVTQSVLEKLKARQRQPSAMDAHLPRLLDAPAPCLVTTGSKTLDSILDALDQDDSSLSREAPLQAFSALGLSRCTDQWQKDKPDSSSSSVESLDLLPPPPAPAPAPALAVGGEVYSTSATASNVSSQKQLSDEEEERSKLL
jgi:hypothetical protein